MCPDNWTLAHRSASMLLDIARPAPILMVARTERVDDVRGDATVAGRSAAAGSHSGERAFVARTGPPNRREPGSTLALPPRRPDAHPAGGRAGLPLLPA